MPLQDYSEYEAKCFKTNRFHKPQWATASEVEKGKSTSCFTGPISMKAHLSSGGHVRA